MHPKFPKAKGLRRWGLLYLLLPIVWTALPSADYYALSDSSWGHRHFVGVSLAYCPLALASRKQSPVFVMRDSNSTMEVACSWMPLPLSVAPQL